MIRTPRGLGAKSRPVQVRQTRLKPPVIQVWRERRFISPCVRRLKALMRLQSAASVSKTHQWGRGGGEPGGGRRYDANFAPKSSRSVKCIVDKIIVPFTDSSTVMHVSAIFVAFLWTSHNNMVSICLIVSEMQHLCTHPPRRFR